MADIRNSSFNDVALMQAAFVAGGSNPANFTGLTGDSEALDQELRDLLPADPGTDDDAPAPGFTTRPAHAAGKGAGHGAQGAGKGMKGQAGEQQGLRDEGGAGAKGKHEGQGTERQGADTGAPRSSAGREGAAKENPGREGAGRDGAGQTGTGKDKAGPPMATASQGNAQTQKRGSPASGQASQGAPAGAANLAANKMSHQQPRPALAQGGANVGIPTPGPEQLVSPSIGQAPAGTPPPGTPPLPGASLAQATGAMSAPASAQAAAKLAAQHAVLLPQALASQGPGDLHQRHAAKGPGKDAVEERAEESTEDSTEGTVTRGSRKRRMAPPPLTGKQSSDSNSNSNSDASGGDGGGSDEGYASGQDSVTDFANPGKPGPRRKREAVASNAAATEAPVADGKASVPKISVGDVDPERIRRIFANLAAKAWDASTDEKAGTVGSYRNMQELLGQIMAAVPPGAFDDPRFPNLKRQSKLLDSYLGIKAERRLNPDKPSDPLGARYLSAADSKLAAAIATGDVFEIVYAIMSVMFGSAMENTRQRALKVREINADQERIRSAQQLVRTLGQGFKPGADGKTKLKDKGSGISEADLNKQILEAQTTLNEIGWDPKTYAGGKGISKETTKQELDDLISNMDSKLTSYNNMNSIETNDLTREAQGAQAYLTGMNSILTKENQALNGIATSLAR
ncbi:MULTISPECIES: hypothetical protein [unclassified Achromobacter]|uniref:hypothetical protein n=1 Tax=unclassified Achromobacter TaxID=2626865 RepID=UPI000B51B0CD|nr:MULTISPECIES: hypothetical protein [unclassified Achromobacter]OWT72710.1 hypothetical protein CEY05_22635 [Achromobacter sp. HZ34]OWT73929.1 hypothetical protein CEY04_21460 [Achromobacter sp. HZ28]